MDWVIMANTGHLSSLDAFVETPYLGSFILFSWNEPSESRAPDRCRTVRMNEWSYYCVEDYVLLQMQVVGNMDPWLFASAVNCTSPS